MDDVGSSVHHVPFMKGSLGIGVLPTSVGLTVIRVDESSDAKMFGVELNDIIIDLDGAPLPRDCSMDEFSRRLASQPSSVVFGLLKDPSLKRSLAAMPHPALERAPDAIVRGPTNDAKNKKTLRKSISRLWRSAKRGDRETRAPSPLSLDASPPSLDADAAPATALTWHAPTNMPPAPPTEQLPVDGITYDQYVGVADGTMLRAGCLESLLLCGLGPASAPVDLDDHTNSEAAHWAGY